MLALVSSVAAAQGGEIASVPEPVAMSCARSPYVFHGLFAGLGGGAVGTVIKGKETKEKGEDFSEFKRTGGLANVIIGYVHALLNGFTVGGQLDLGFPFGLKVKEGDAEDKQVKTPKEKATTFEVKPFSVGGSVLLGYNNAKMRGMIAFKGGFEWGALKVKSKIGTETKESEKEINLFSIPLGAFYACKVHKNVAITVGGEYKVGLKAKEKLGEKSDQEIEFSPSGWSAGVAVLYNL